jgi:hypothetical protein
MSDFLLLQRERNVGKLFVKMSEDSRVTVSSGWLEHAPK